MIYMQHIIIDFDNKNIETRIGYCFLAPIVAMAKYQGFDYEMTFAGTIFFGFLSQDNKTYKLFSERIYTNNNPDTYTIKSLNYSGVGLINQKTDFITFKKFVSNNLLNGQPILFSFDAFYSSWSSYYYKHHLRHFALIIGQTNDYYIVVDPYVANSPQKFFILDAEAGYIAHYEKKITKPELSLDHEWKNMLRQSVMGNLKNIDGWGSCYKMLRNLCSEINESNRIIKEIKTQSQDNSYCLQQQFKYLAYGRLNYSWMLKYLGNKYNVESLISISQDMEYISDEMITVLSLLTKMSYIENECKLEQLKKYIADKLFHATYKEEKCMIRIIEIIS